MVMTPIKNYQNVNILYRGIVSIKEAIKRSTIICSVYIVLNNCGGHVFLVIRS